MDNTNLSNKGIGELQRSCERFEGYNDGFILPDTLLMLRIDAHRLGDWSKVGDHYPTGPDITKLFAETARRLMTSSFRVVLAYAHGDEISLLFDPTENMNPMRRSKLLSSVASAAASHFVKLSGLELLFDGRLAELPSAERVVEYLFWQRRYCFRNAATIALRRALLASGMPTGEVEKSLQGITEKRRLELLEQHGVALDDIPHATRRGTLFYWDTQVKDGREHFRIVTDASLTDDDALYVERLGALVAAAIGLSGPADPIISRPSANVDQQPLSTSPTAAAAPPSAREYRSNKKTNVSVFKMSSAVAKR